MIRWPESAAGDLPQVGDVVRAEIPMLDSLGLRPRYIECTAQVVRVSCEEDDAETLVALHIRQMRMKPQKARLSQMASQAVM